MSLEKDIKNDSYTCMGFFIRNWVEFVLSIIFIIIPIISILIIDVNPTIIITICTPLLAFFISRVYLNESLRKERKFNILMGLMINRNGDMTNIDPEFRKALNSIEVVFYESQKIKDLNKEYYKSIQSTSAKLEELIERQQDLIQAIAKNVGYNFDTSIIKKVYPINAASYNASNSASNSTLVNQDKIKGEI